jgi:glycosyltransferase involved in cell wall biosynthesis|tara:strand:- start:2618 stop:3814 length:1197 start_codon:yes stop_codon:yes gene_type:complete
MNLKPNVLYISYDGLLEPLGQSQILSYLKILSKDYNISVLSFEKKKDWLNEKNVDSVKTLIDNYSLEWTSLSYTKRPLVISTLYDLSKGIYHAFYIAITRKVEIVHARGYIPALIAFILTRLKKLKFIFDMRGFWADERVDWGIWKKKNLIYFLFKFLENQFFSKADAIVSLTKVGVDRIRERVEIDETKVEIKVIPTCADLELFSLRNERPKKLVMAHVGAVETRYEFHRTLDIFKRIQNITSSEFHIVNKGEHDYIEHILEQNKIALSDVKIFESIFSEMPNHLSKISFGAFFPKKGFYLNGYFPTKLGEFLACGKPLVCGKVNEDVETIIKENKVGVIIDFEKDISIEDKLRELIDISNSTGISEKCRKVAETLFSAKQGAKDYSSLYRSLLIQS